MSNRLYFPATIRNRLPIAKVLSDFLPTDGIVLEIASGSGEHGVEFQKLFPKLLWQTNDPNPIYRESISSWIEYTGLKGKMPEPIDLDVTRKPWNLPKILTSQLGAIVCINLLHISPWSCAEDLFSEANDKLSANSPLIIYGPFKREGKHTSESNYIFDMSLKERNVEWGIRNFEEVKDLATKCGFKRNFAVEMPANNLSVIFYKKTKQSS